MSDSNTQLVESIVGGAHHRFGEVVRRFDQQVRIAISRKVQDPAAIEDLTQETFYKAFQKLNRLENPEQLPAWLLVIARNCLTDHFRRQQRRQDCEYSGGMESANRQLTKRPDWIWDEVAQLPGEFAEVLELRYRQSRSYREIAKQIGRPESTVRGRIYEARKALRLRLNEKGLL